MPHAAEVRIMAWRFSMLISQPTKTKISEKTQPLHSGNPTLYASEPHIEKPFLWHSMQKRQPISATAVLLNFNHWPARGPLLSLQASGSWVSGTRLCWITELKYLAILICRSKFVSSRSFQNFWKASPEERSECVLVILFWNKRRTINWG